jgi:predicted kinase
MRSRADAVLASGRPVIVDASFRSKSERAAFRSLAEQRDVPFHLATRTLLDEVKRLARQLRGDASPRT